MKETHTKVSHLISELSFNNHINDKIKRSLSQTPNPPRIPVFYTVAKLHKPTLAERPIISGCNGPAERLSALVDTFGFVFYLMISSMAFKQIMKLGKFPSISLWYVQ